MTVRRDKRSSSYFDFAQDDGYVRQTRRRDGERRQTTTPQRGQIATITKRCV